MPGIILARG
ncbi:hypothetical protein PDE_06851 [Penicillium oxalicum 114-2]|uniref:Uncharacterized protein n=1 Tax=Penicillium oxalicum (strain 114-2 / CGMCC 5302) TaxID=933388 RepID=S8AZM2_PENO1|nr:hypothetical protein PDE_06851 [Penicillium oxalicum 114-2]